MFLLTIIDLSFSSFIVAPLVISFWRGIWEYYTFLSSSYPLWWTLFISTALHFTFSLIKDILLDFSYEGWGHIVTRIYIYIFGVATVTQWKSLWTILEQNMGQDLRILLPVTIISVVTLLLLKGIRNIVSVPFLINLDHDAKEIVSYTTMFKTESTGDLWKFVLDCGFSVCVVGSLVVFVWRGVWSLLDLFLFPEQIAKSAWASLGIGYGLVLASFAAQPLMKALVTRADGILRLCAVDVYLMFSFCGTINVWRGVWNILNVYLLPEKPVVSYWLSHLVAFGLLVLVNSSNSILVRGVYIDAEEEGEQCVDFPCYYLRLFFQEKRRKKLMKQMQKKQVETLARRRSEADGLIKENFSDGEKRRQSLQLMINSNCQEIV